MADKSETFAINIYFLAVTRDPSSLVSMKTETELWGGNDSILGPDTCRDKLFKDTRRYGPLTVRLKKSFGYKGKQKFKSAVLKRQNHSQ